MHFLVVSPGSYDFLFTLSGTMLVVHNRDRPENFEFKKPAIPSFNCLFKGFLDVIPRCLYL